MEDVGLLLLLMMMLLQERAGLEAGEGLLTLAWVVLLPVRQIGVASLLLTSAASMKDRANIHLIPSIPMVLQSSYAGRLNVPVTNVVKEGVFVGHPSSARSSSRSDRIEATNRCKGLALDLVLRLKNDAGSSVEND